MNWPALTAGWLCVVFAARLGAQENRSFSDSVIEFQEAKLTLQGISEENKELQTRLREAEEAVKSLTESLAVANGEADYFKQQSFDLKLRMEALGVESIASGKSDIEQRLLKAVRDLQAVQEEKNAMAEQLIQLSEAVLHYLKNADSTDFEARMHVEEALRKSSEKLGFIPGRVKTATAAPSTLTDGLVISVKDEFGLVVMNVGKLQGVKLGMSFRVVRGEKEIAIIKAVNVRESITGGVVQELSSETDKIKVGDRLKVEVR